MSRTCRSINYSSLVSSGLQHHHCTSRRRSSGGRSRPEYRAGGQWTIEITWFAWTCIRKSAASYTHAVCTVRKDFALTHHLHEHTNSTRSKGAQKDRGAKLRLHNWTHNYTQYQIKYLKPSVKFESFSLAFEWNQTYVVGWEDDSAS